MRFSLQHPHQARVEAVYGHDRTAIGWFAEVRASGRLLAEYDGLVVERPTMAGVLRVMVEHRFFEADDINEAADHLKVGDVDDIDDPSVRTAAQVLVRLKQAAAE